MKFDIFGVFTIPSRCMILPNLKMHGQIPKSKKRNWEVCIFFGTSTSLWGSHSECTGEIATERRWYASRFLRFSLQLQVRSETWSNMMIILPERYRYEQFVYDTNVWQRLLYTFFSVRALKRGHLWFPVFSGTWPVVQNVLLSGRLSTWKSYEAEARSSLLQGWCQAHCVHKQGSFRCQRQPFCQEFLPCIGLQKIIEKRFQYCIGRGSSNTSRGIRQWF